MLVQSILIAAAIINSSFKPEVLAVNTLATTDWSLTPIYSKTYFDNGVLKAEGRLLDSNKIGWWNFYYSNNNIKKKGAYLKGEKHGFWETFYKNGQTELLLEWNQGLKSGWANFL